MQNHCNVFPLFLSSMPYYQAEYLIFRKWPIVLKPQESYQNIHKKRTELIIFFTNYDFKLRRFHSKLCTQNGISFCAGQP